MADSPFDTLMQVSMGFTLPRTLHVIAELGIADALDETPLSAKALAAATGIDADALNRAMRVLCAHGIFERQADGYGHTPASRLLAFGSPAVHALVRTNARHPCIVAHLGAFRSLAADGSLCGGENTAKWRILGLFRR